MSAHVKSGQQSQQPCGQCSRLSGKAFSADPTPPPVTLMFLGPYHVRPGLGDLGCIETGEEAGFLRAST